jgi:hypothetical protein
MQKKAEQIGDDLLSSSFIEYAKTLTRSALDEGRSLPTAFQR